MSQSFNKIAIIGPGLLGGSIGLACREKGMEVSFWGRSEERIGVVRQAGFSATTDLSQAIFGAQLIILAIPVPYMESMATQLVEAGLTREQLVTDVGSVKQAVLNSVQPILSEREFRFIGSHPMAGSEQQGFDAANAKILEGAMCIITPKREEDQVDELKLFWENLGMKVSALSPDQHDEIVSRVSHVPHILASTCAHVALPQEGFGQYSGGGLRDTSRVASGDPELWTGIVMENSEAIVKHLGEAIEQLKNYQQAVLDEDEDRLKNLFSEDKVRRDSHFG